MLSRLIELKLRRMLANRGFFPYKSGYATHWIFGGWLGPFCLKFSQNPAEDLGTKGNNGGLEASPNQQNRGEPNRGIADQAMLRGMNPHGRLDMFPILVAAHPE